jgi:hypothetical protein
MAGSFQVVGRIEGVHAESTQIVMLSTEDDFNKLKPIAALRLLVATAQGLSVDRLVVVNRHDKWKPGALTTKGTPAPVAQVRTLRLETSIDQTQAQTRLAALCDLVRTALVSPCASFGGAATDTLADRAKGGKTFGQFVHGRSYEYSSELIVYGANPQFDDVFVANAPELAFRARFDSQFTVTYNRSTKEYLIS